MLHPVALDLILDLILATTLPACAQVLSEEVTPADRQAFAARAAAFEGATVEDTPQALIDFTPPAVRAVLADQEGVPEQELLAEVRQECEASGSVFVGFDLDVSTAPFGVTPRGRPYAFVRGEGLMKEGSERCSVRGEVVALKDDGQWFFHGVGLLSTIFVLLEACPEFEGVRSPCPSLETPAEEVLSIERE